MRDPLQHVHLLLRGQGQPLPDMERRFPHGAPSLRQATALTVEGDVTFGADVTVVGDVTVRDGETVGDHAILRG